MPGLWKALRAIAVSPEESTGHRRALRLVGLAIVVAFTAFGVAAIDLRRLAASLATARPSFLLLAAAASGANLVFHAFRWAAVVRPPGVRVRAADVLYAMSAGLAVGLAVPARAGDFVRAHLLARRAGLRRSVVLASAALDYMIGTVALVLLAGVLALSTPLPPWARDALAATSIGTAGAVLVLFFLRPPREGHATDGPGLGGLVARLRSGLSAVHEPTAIARAFAWSVATWASELAIVSATLAAFDLPRSMGLAALVVLATAVANAIALSPGNAGPFEIAAMLPVASVAVAPEPALAFALLLHLVYLAPVALVGGWVLLREAARSQP